MSCVVLLLRKAGISLGFETQTMFYILCWKWLLFQMRSLLWEVQLSVYFSFFLWDCVSLVEEDSLIWEQWCPKQICKVNTSKSHIENARYVLEWTYCMKENNSPASPTHANRFIGSLLARHFATFHYIMTADITMYWSDWQKMNRVSFNISKQCMHKYYQELAPSWIYTEFWETSIFKFKASLNRYDRNAIWIKVKPESKTHPMKI